MILTLTELRSNLDYMSVTNKQTILKIILISLAVFVGVLWLANLKNSLISKGEPSSLTTESITQTLENNLNENANLINASTEMEKVFVNQLMVEANNIKPQPDTEAPVLEEPIENYLSEPDESADSELTKPINPNQTNCPAYVNCMPTFGEPARPCVIPPGCEGVTEKVY